MNGRIETLAPLRGTIAVHPIAFTGRLRTLTPLRATAPAPAAAAHGILRSFAPVRGTNVSPPVNALGRLVPFGRAVFVGPFAPPPAVARFFGKIPTVSISFTPPLARAVFAMLAPLARVTGRANAVLFRNAETAELVRDPGTAAVAREDDETTASRNAASATMRRT